MKFINIFSMFMCLVSAAFAGKIMSCKEENTIALTFDDGPFQYTSELLDILRETNITATFFINAENYWKDLVDSSSKRSVLKQAYEDGHQIASHTWMHQIPGSQTEIKEMMEKMDDFIEDVIGQRPNYFRAPGGNCDSACTEYFEELGYKVIQWDTDTNDWNTNVGADERVALVKEFLTDEWERGRDNYLVLMHDVQKHTVRQIVPWIIENAPYRKYRFVSVAECLGEKDSMYKSGKVIEKVTPVIETPTPSLNETEKVDNSTMIDDLDDDNQFHLTNGANDLASNLIYVFAVAISLYALLYMV